MDNESKKQYFEKYWKDNLYNYPTKVPMKNIIGLVECLKNKSPSMRILDAGCGEGRHAILFAKHGFESYGIDISEEAIRKAVQNALAEKVQVKFAVASFLRHPYEKRFFDVILDVAFLHCLRKKDAQRYLGVISGLLKAGGLYCSVQFSKCTNGLNDSVHSNKNWIIKDKIRYHLFTMAEFEKFLGKKFKKLGYYEFTGGVPAKNLCYYLGKLKK
jgi:2-polyprenyl-3-methyl-5-hydroxy-6-metoxy-1,4-benzoquinol methylase